LLPFLTGARNGTPHDALYWRMGGIMAIRRGDWKLVKMYEGGNADEISKLTLDGAQLFNIARDKSEQNDLAKTQPARVKELSDTWLRWRNQLRTPLWAPPPGYRGTRLSCLDQSLARPLDSYTGTWRGSFAAMTDFTWEQRSDGTGSIRVGSDPATTPTRVVHVSTDSLVVDVTEPVLNRGASQMVTLRLINYVCGDELRGIVQSTRPDNTVARTPLTATRSRR
jgi:hypothetical protein